MMHRDLGEKIFVGSQYNRERDYWLDKLSGELTKTGFLPDTLPDKAGMAGSVGREIQSLKFRFSPGLFDRLMQIVNNSDSRLHITLAMGLTLFLYKYTGSLDIIIGTPIDRQDIEGEYINTILPLRSRIDEQINVKEFLKQVKQTIIEASENQNYPIEALPHELGVPMFENDWNFPLFDIAFLLSNIQDKQYIAHINLDMLFSFLRTEESLEGIVEYNAAAFEKETVERIVDHFLRLMWEAFSNVDLKLVDVPMLTEEEKHNVLFEFNNTAADYPRTRMIHQLFEEQMERTPEHIAVQNGSQQLTYRDLNKKANQLARLLKEKGVGNEIIIAIMLESSNSVPLAIMAVLKAGGAYLPMGFEYPGERVDYILKNSRSQLLLTRKTLVEGKNINSPILFLDDETNYNENTENLEPVNNTESLVYVIYTSGTTGQPKGVMVKHPGLVNYIWWASHIYVNKEPLDFPLYTSISFDLTVTSIFTPLITGNTIIVYGGVHKKLYIEEVIDDNRVGVVKLTPSHLKLIRFKTITDSSIKRFIVGGEELETSLANDIYHNFSGKIEIYNEYGPTETVVGSMIYKFNPDYDTRYSVPIGKPVANTQVYILNNHYQPVPIGVVGELYIGGSGLARGYLYNPGQTEEKFVPDPFINGQKIYKTGDLAARLADGNIEYKGRIDHQVKIRGHRIETGEIEAKIIDFQRISRAGREQKENIVEKIDLKSLQYCKTCLIPANYPGGIKFDEHGICDICREFETYKDKALAYFKTIPDFHQVVARAQKTKKSKYDCLLLYSGGKDSSYTLHRLVDMGLKVLAFTFDNGYISAKAFENIDRTVKLLNIDHIMLDSQAMKEIFVESLWSDYNVCNGCFKAVNTLGTKIAHDHQINLVISGLTRGQIFDIKLHGLFKLGVFEEETIEERLNLFRKNYHSMTHRTSRLIGVEISDETLENTYFVDYFRYDKITTEDIFEYLKEKDRGWVRPTDTGASSSNCIINDIGIYVHLKDKGCHFYAPQLSWDCRLGTITRGEGLEEMWGYQVDYPMTRQVLDEIGYYNAFTGAVVTEVKDDRDEKVLCAYILADKELEVSELRNHLARELPDYMIPTYFTRIDRIPLTSSGKIDRKALPKPELTFKEEYVAPRNPVEEKLVEVWSELLGIKREKISIDVNFFEVGGHSLRATFLAASINKEFNVKVPLVKIFEAPTIRGLAKYIKDEAEEHSFISITPALAKDYYALSSAQRRLYILQQMQLNSIAYNVPNIVELHGELEKKKFEETFQKLIIRHESLRTSFVMIGDTFAQKVYPSSLIQFKIIFNELEPGIESIEKAISKKVRAFIRPFDLSQAPLLRVELLRIEPLMHILMVDMHHILTDGISYQIFVKDFLSFYHGQELSPIRIQYKDYSEWQQSEKGQEIFKQQEEYWIRQFKDEVSELNLPTDWQRPAIQSFEGDTMEFEISEAESKILNGIALSEGATLFMVLFAAFNIFLSKLSNEEDLTIGIPIAGRIHADLEEVIGIFINMLAIRNFPKGEFPFTLFLENLKIKVLESFENQGYSFEDLVEKVDVKRNVSRNPVFDVLFVLQNMLSTSSFDPGEIDAQKRDELMVKPFTFENKTSKYDLSLLCIEKGPKLFFTFEYCTKLFSKESILRFINYFKKIITVITENSETKISEIELLSENEKKQLLYDFNDTEIDYPKDKVIHQLFEEQANKNPNRIAILFEDKAITYNALEKHANWVANYLFYNKNIQNEERIGILMDRSLNIIIAMLGILKAGGAYVPIDSSLPEARIKYIIDNAEINGLISETHLLKKLNNLQFDGKKLYVFLCLDEHETVEKIPRSFHHEQSNLANLNYDSLILEENHKLHADNLAYVIYTSGTTGMPKGIMIQHRSVNNFIKGITDIIDFNENDYVLSLTTISFDIFGLETLAPITSGARVVIGNNNEQLNNIALINALIKQNISIFQVTPARLQFLFSEDLSSSMFNKLKYLLVGGESFPEALLTKARTLISGKIYNLYGPTETTIWSTIKDVTGENSLNIGKPIANTKIYILNENKSLLPIGVRGKLYIGGDGLARGYLNNDKLTKEKFIDNPFFDGQRIYETGDLARWLPDGNLEFLGRMDQQVKIRGFRIELGEIEYQLSKINGITESVVIDKIAENGDKYLCAYVVSKKEIVVSEIRNILSNTLPDYMLPSYFIRIEKIPLTPSNKIDRKELPTPTIQSRENNIAPRDKLEERLVELWSEGLNVEKNAIGINSNFFELGGHSLKATILITKIHKEFYIRFPLQELFKRPNIKNMSEYIKAAVKEENVSLEMLEKKEYYPASSQQKRLYMIQQRHLHFIAYNRPNAYISEIELNKEKLEATFRQLIQRHESLRTSFDMIDGELVQHIHNDVSFAIENDDGDFVRPFDLSAAPLLRIRITQTNSGQNILWVDIHHIISDGISDSLLVNDFIALYQEKQLPLLKYQYKEFTHWQVRLMATGEMKKQEDYWLETFTGEIPQLAIPRDYPYPDGQNFEGSSIYLELDKEDVGHLNEIARQEGVTLFMLLLAAYNILLAKLAGQEDIVVGTGVAGRRHADFEMIIGMFVNTLALRNYPNEEKILKDFLREVKERTLLAFENQEYLFENLVEKVLSKRETGRNPLFDTSFVMQNIEMNTSENTATSNLILKPYSVDKKKSIFDIAVFCQEIGNKLSISVTYSTAIFKKETIEKYFSYYKDILAYITMNKELSFTLKDIRLSGVFKNFESKLMQNETGDFGF